MSSITITLVLGQMRLIIIIIIIIIVVSITFLFKSNNVNIVTTLLLVLLSSPVAQGNVFAAYTKQKFSFSIYFVPFLFLTPCFFSHRPFSFASLSFLVSRLRRKKVVLNIDVPLLTEDASSTEDRYSTVCETSLVHALLFFRKFSLQNLDISV